MGSTPTITFLETGEVCLRIVDFGGNGLPIFLLRGLCGTANEWFDTAEFLRKHAHVVAYDQRGHGESTRSPADLSRNALVNDAMAVMNATRMQDAIVLGNDLVASEPCRDLLYQESVFAGGSSGFVIAGIRSLVYSFAGSTVVTLLPDRGERYMDTVYSDEWLANLHKSPGIPASR